MLLNSIDVDPERRRGYVYTELRTNVAGASKLADVAVEILSPRDDLEDQRAKCQWYIVHGAHVAMLVDPGQRSVTVFESVGRLQVLSSPGTVVLRPGLELGTRRRLLRTGRLSTQHQTEPRPVCIRTITTTT